MGKFGLVLLVVFLSAGCVGDTFTECKIGELTGSWQATYQEADGTCGPLTSEVIVFTAGEPNPACTVHTQTISADKCRLTSDITCPLDGGGTVRRTEVYDHIAPSHLSGTLTGTVDSPSGFCRSTYNVDLREL